MEDYYEKTDHLTTDLSWNLPERRQGSINIIGGHAGRFNSVVKISEFVAGKYPLEEIHTVLPDDLKSKLPNLPNFTFLPSTDAGSFADADEITKAIDSADYSLLLGDFSKNSITARALAAAVKEASRPLLLTRDTVDLIAEASPDAILMKENIVYLASLPQLQKLLRAVYYPKMLMLSAPLTQITEILHKFTLSYPAHIITLVGDQILLAEDGLVRAVPLAKSGYLPFTFWSGELAAKVAVINLYSPHRFLDSTTTAIFT